MDIKCQIYEIAKRAKTASTILARMSSEVKNRALLEIAEELVRQSGALMKENAKDLEYAGQMGIPAAMKDRLALNQSTVEGIAKGLREVAALPDPVAR